MAYSDYEFYTTKYYGSLIKEDDYPKFSDMAFDKLNLVTYDNITEEHLLDEKLSVKIKKAECAIAETLYKINQVDAMSGIGENGKGKIIKSESSGAVSQSYEVGKTLTEKSISTTADIDKLIYVSVKTYLTGTGLLYAGL